MGVYMYGPTCGMRGERVGARLKRALNSGPPGAADAQGSGQSAVWAGSQDRINSHYAHGARVIVAGSGQPLRLSAGGQPKRKEHTGPTGAVPLPFRNLTPINHCHAGETRHGAIARPWGRWRFDAAHIIGACSRTKEARAILGRTHRSHGK